MWTLALYGLLEIIKTIIYICTYTNLKSDGTYLIVAVKNQENKIEFFMRSLLFRFLYGNEDYLKNIIIADLNSTDNTKKILNHLEKDLDVKSTDHDKKSVKVCGLYVFIFEIFTKNCFIF